MTSPLLFRMKLRWCFYRLIYSFIYSRILFWIKFHVWCWVIWWIAVRLTFFLENLLYPGLLVFFNKESNVRTNERIPTKHLFMMKSNFIACKHFWLIPHLFQYIFVAIIFCRKQVVLKFFALSSCVNAIPDKLQSCNHILDLNKERIDPNHHIIKPWLQSSQNNSNIRKWATHLLIGATLSM
jgi:hypothetical protein